MVQTIQHPSPLTSQHSLLTAFTQQLNLEKVQAANDPEAVSQQNLMTLDAEGSRSEAGDRQDVTIAILEGNGSLTLHGEAVALEPGLFVFIPAETPHTVQTQTGLTYLLIRCEPEPVESESIWVVRF